jgi:diacylglycerol O-acyltransferase / wax synthase
MKRLTGLESLYLRLETDSMPMNMSSLTIYDRSAAPGGSVGFADIQRFVAERAYRAGLFRRRLATLPLSIARPYWIDDPGFDIEFHVRHIALPKPGDWRQLCTQVARLHARPLDRSRPLWECYVIEELDNIQGLPPGSFALFFKTHSAALGGVVAAQLFSALHELSPDARASAPKDRRYFDHAPTLVDLAARATADTLGSPLALARYVAASAGPLGRLAAREAGAIARRALGVAADEAPTVALPAPRTRFNNPVSPHRVVDGVRFPLPEIERMIEHVPGATVEDVAVTVIGGALHAYLDARLETPATSLVAEIPIGTRTDPRSRPGRSFADSAVMPIYTDIENAAERLQRVVAAARRLHADGVARMGRKLVVDALQFVPAPVLGTVGDLAQWLRLGSRLAPIVNASIASVRGPDVPLYFAGAPLVGYYGLSVIHDLAGLAHVVGQYHGAVTIGVTACRTMMPDPGRYAACLYEAYDELADALGLRTDHRHEAMVESHARWQVVPMRGRAHRLGATAAG